MDNITNQNMSQPAENITMAQKSSVIGTVIKTVVGIVVIGLIAFSYVTFANPFAGKSPEAIIEKTIAHMYDSFFSSTKSSNMSIVMDYNMSIDTISPDSDKHILTRLSIPFEFNIEKGLDTGIVFGMKINDADMSSVMEVFGIPSSDNEKLGLDARVFFDAEKLYLKVNNMPQFVYALASMFGVANLDVLKESWMVAEFSDADSLVDTGGLDDLTEEQIESLIQLAQESFMSPLVSDVTKEKVPEGIAITYTYDYQKLQQAGFEFDKKAREIVGSEGDDTTVADIDENKEGTITYTVVIDSSMDIVRIESSSHIKNLENEQLIDITTVSNFKMYADALITEPQNAVPFETVMQKLMGDSISRESSNLSSGANNSDSVIRSKLSSIRASAEVAYMINNDSYGKKPFPLGKCSVAASTLFGESDISSTLLQATGNNIALATCVSSGSVGQVDAYAISVPLSASNGTSLCVDSAGSLQEISGAITEASCQ